MIARNLHISPYQQWLNKLQSFDQAQFTFNNTTGQDQVIKLWAAHEGNSFQNKIENFNTGASPQAIAFDSNRNLFFVVNQLASTVDVFSPSGVKQHTILLEADEFAFASPLAITVDKNSGVVYVIGAISNRLYVISPSFEVTHKISLDNRPISMALNRINQHLYISHLLTKQITVIDLANLAIKDRITTDEVVTSLVIHPNTGDWLIVQPALNTIQVFDSLNQSKSKLTNLGTGISKAQFMIDENSIIVIVNQSKEIIKVDISTGEQTAKKELTNEPISLNIGKNDTIYVGTNEPATIHLLNQELMLLSASNLTAVHSDLFISEESQLIYIPKPATNTISIEALGEGQNIQTSDNYMEVLRDFQNKPAHVKHLKLFYSGEALAPVMRLGTKSTRGQKISKVVSLNNYRSPQHFQPIYEVLAIHGEIIDGNAFWELTLPKSQQLTVMLYYEQ